MARDALTIPQQLTRLDLGRRRAYAELLSFYSCRSSSSRNLRELKQFWSV